MNETTKASRRRCREASEGKFPWDDIFKGKILDVGSGNDPLPGATPFDLPDGSECDLTKFFPPSSFDVIHGSQVIEHAVDPKIMLQSWLDCLKPGGYVVATVPDWELFEKCTWPSRYNAGHRTAWSMNTIFSVTARSDGKHTSQVQAPIIKLPEWLEPFPVEVLMCRLVDTNFDYSLGPEIDQTYDPDKGVEAFIELVLRKKG